MLTADASKKYKNRKTIRELKLTWSVVEAAMVLVSDMI